MVPAIGANIVFPSVWGANQQRAFAAVGLRLLRHDCIIRQLPHFDMINLSVNFDFILFHKKSSLYNQQMEFI
jgi:hypothetical protein